MARLYNSQEKLYVSTFQYVHLTSVVDALAQLLTILVTIDAAVAQNTGLGTAWADFKRMMQFVRDKPEMYASDEATVSRFERLLVQLDNSLLRAQCFRNCLDRDFEEMAEGGTVNVRSNPAFLQELFFCLRTRVDRTEASIGSAAETSERKDMVGLTALYALYRRLPAFFRRLWAVQVKLPLVVLAGKLAWFLPEFLETHAPLQLKKLEPEPGPSRRAYLEKLDEVFAGTVKRLHLEVVGWSVEVANKFGACVRLEQDTVGLLDLRGSLLLRGLVTAHKLSNLVKTFVNLHLALGVPMQRKVLRPLSMCVELLKALEVTVQAKSAVAGESMFHAMKILSARLIKVVRPVRSKLQAARKFDDHKMDVLAAVNVIESLLFGSDSFTPSRISVLSLALGVCLNPNVVKESELEVFIYFKIIYFRLLLSCLWCCLFITVGRLLVHLNLLKLFCKGGGGAVQAHTAAVVFPENLQSGVQLQLPPLEPRASAHFHRRRPGVAHRGQSRAVHMRGLQRCGGAPAQRPARGRQHAAPPRL